MQHLLLLIILTMQSKGTTPCLLSGETKTRERERVERWRAVLNHHHLNGFSDWAYFSGRVKSSFALSIRVLIAGNKNENHILYSAERRKRGPQPTDSFSYNDDGICNASGFLYFSFRFSRWPARIFFILLFIYCAYFLLRLLCAFQLHNGNIK